MWSLMVSMVLYFKHTQSITLNLNHHKQTDVDFIFNDFLTYDFRHFSSRPCQFCSFNPTWFVYIQKGGCEGWDTGHICRAYLDGSRTQKVQSKILYEFPLKLISRFPPILIVVRIYYRWNSSNPWSDYSPISVAWTANVDEVVSYIKNVLMKPWKLCDEAPNSWRGLLNMMKMKGWDSSDFLHGDIFLVL